MQTLLLLINNMEKIYLQVDDWQVFANNENKNSVEVLVDQKGGKIKVY